MIGPIEFYHILNPRLVRRTSIFFIGSILVALISGLIFSIFEIDLMDMVYDQGIFDLTELINEDGTINAFKLIPNNITVGLNAVISGFVPFLHLPWLFFLINIIVSGLVIGSIAMSSPLLVIKSFVFGILPHGIIEIPAIVLSISLGLCVCKHLTNLIRKRPNTLSFTTMILSSLVFFILVIVPMFIIAGLAEVHITPYFLGLI